MPKPKRIKNLLKSISGASQHASSPANTSQPEVVQQPVVVESAQQQIEQQNVQQQSPQEQGAQQQSVQQGAQHQSQEQTSQQQNSQPETQTSQRKVGRHSTHYWFVDAIDEQGVIKKLKVKVKDVHNLAIGLRIIVEFDDLFQPIGEGSSVLTGVCGQLATDPNLFPISFESWHNMPDAYLDNVWNTTLKTRFCFKVNEDIAKRSVEFSISKKWREFRIKLWNEFYDPLRSKDELIKNVPNGLSMEQWALFVDYRLKPSTMNLCKRNQEIRKKQTIPHTGGAMPLSRRREYMRIETGKNIGRGEMWKVTHKRKNGNYVNDEAMEIGEKIDEYLSQNSENGSVISPDDVIGVIFGKEHPGRVRGLGTGVCHTIAFKHTTTRIKGVSLGSFGASTSDMEKMEEKVAYMENEVEKMEEKVAYMDNEVNSMKSQMQTQTQAFLAYIASKEGGKIPTEIASLFPTHTPQSPPDIGSGPRSFASPPNNIRRSSEGSNVDLDDD